MSASGRVALIRWEFAGQQPGSLDKFLPSGLDGDPLIAITQLPTGDCSELSLGLLSSDGRFKRLPLAEVLDLSGRATSVVKLKEGVRLCSAVICREHSDLVLVSSMGRLLRLPVNDSVLPKMGRLAQGPMTMRLLPGEELVGSLAINVAETDPTLLLVSRQGQMTRIDVTSLRRCQRGDLGMMAVALSSDEDGVIGLCSGAALAGIVTNQKRHGRLDAAAVDLSEAGESWIDQLNLESGEQIVSVVALQNS